MESPIELLKRLIDEGEKFNFQNFCYPRTDYPGKYGGDDTPEWLAWKTRCRNLIGQVLDENSPSNLLIKQGLGVRTTGNHPIEFEKAMLSLQRRSCFAERPRRTCLQEN
jgi:hypothetical protein